MAQDDAIYVVDVYVPNEGEFESSLELAILRLTSLQDRPSVYVHTYLQPVNYNLDRIRWRDAAKFGIRQSTIENNNWPTLNDICLEEYLKGKDVVCFSNAMEPIQTLVQDARITRSIVDMWHKVFASDSNVSSINDPFEMLEHLGLPAQDSSNTKYTPLMKRMFAQIAIWMYLMECLQSKSVFNITASFDGLKFWPLNNVPDPWYNSEAKQLNEISHSDLETYFSSRLPDFIDWSNMFIYKHDWVFARKRSSVVNLSGQESMIEYIYYRLFNFKTKLLVLAFYAIYNDRINYARTIALNSEGQFKLLPFSVKEDFGSFVISHLDDFLSGSQKHSIISALVEQVIISKSEKHCEDYDYDELKRYKHENGLSFEEKRLHLNSSICWYREIRDNEEVLYRGFIIRGSLDERNECVDHINAKLTEIVQEVRNPFSSIWLSSTLKSWINFITGFNWSELSRMPRPNDSDTLTNARKTINDIVRKFSSPFVKTFLSNIEECTSQINEVEEGDKTRFYFIFQGVFFDILVDKTVDKGGIFKRIFGKF